MFTIYASPLIARAYVSGSRFVKDTEGEQVNR
jgi:hypothetical protein